MEKQLSVVKWLEHITCPVTWFSIDHSDNNIEGFWNYIIASLDHVIPGLEERFSAIFGANRISIDRIITILIDEFHKYGENFILVMDDYHCIKEPDIHESLALMIKYLPPNVHLIIISRSQLPFYSARMLMVGQFQELNLYDLQFTSQEIRDFLALKNITCSENDLMTLQTKTEGWAAGLYLLLTAMEKGNINHALSGFGFDSERIESYLYKEVMSHRSDEERMFFLQTSILPSFNGSLCDALTGRTDSKEVLLNLVAQNPFIRVVDKDGLWYRYHNLFSDFLLKRLENIPRINRTTLYNKAGDWFKDNGYYREAINQYLQASSYEKIADVTEKIGKKLLKIGEVDTIYRWLEVCPEAVILKRDILCMIYAWSLVLLNRINEAEFWLNMLNLKIEAASEELYSDWKRQTMAEVAILNAFIGMKQKNPRRTLEYYFSYQELMVEKSIIISFGIDFNIGEASLLSGIFGIKGHLHILETEYLSLYNNIRGLLKNRLGFVPVLIGEIHYQRNKMDEAVNQLMLGSNEAEDNAINGCLIPYFITLSKILMSRGDIGGANDIVNNGEVKLRKMGCIHLLPYLAAFRVRLGIITDDLFIINEWMQKNCIDYLDNPSIPKMYEFITLARVYIARKDYERSMLLISKLLLFVEKEDNVYYMLEILNLKALVYLNLGHTQKAMDTLKQSLLLGEENSYERIFIDEGAPMAALLERFIRTYKKSKIGEDTSTPIVSPVYIRRLIKYTRDYSIALKSFTRKKGKYLDRDINAIENLTRREKEVLHLLDSDLTYLEISYTLDISINTVKVNCTNIYRKLASRNREQALRKAKEACIIK